MSREVLFFQISSVAIRCGNSFEGGVLLLKIKTTNRTSAFCLNVAKFLAILSLVLLIKVLLIKKKRVET